MASRIRVLIHKQGDLLADLGVVGRLRYELWAHSPVEIDPDDPASRPKRSLISDTTYFEFETEFPDEVERVVKEYGYSDLVTIERLPTSQETVEG